MPVARFPRDPASAAAEVNSPHLHQNRGSSPVRVGCLCFIEGELNHVRTARRAVHEPVLTLVNTLIFCTVQRLIDRGQLPCEKCRQLPPSVGYTFCFGSVTIPLPRHIKGTDCRVAALLAMTQTGIVPYPQARPWVGRRPLGSFTLTKKATTCYVVYRSIGQICINKGGGDVMDGGSSTGTDTGQSFAFETPSPAFPL